MDESAIVTNIATILAKDTLLDRSPRAKGAPYPIQQFRRFLEDSDDGLDYYIYNQLRKRKQENKRNNEKYSETASENSSQQPFGDATEASPNQFRPGHQKMPVNLLISSFLPPRDFGANFHMKKCTYNALLEVLAPLMKQSIREIDETVLSSDTFLSLAIWKLTTNQHFEEISQRFKLPVHICSHLTSNFCDLIANYLKTFISWPNRHQIINLRNIAFPQLVGVIGTRQFDVFLESQDEDVSVILQLVCTNNLIITDCYLDLTANYSVSGSPIWKRLEEAAKSQSADYLIPSGYYLIAADGTFPLKSYLITPFGKVDCEEKARFNRLLEDQSKIFGQTINQMMNRFQALYSLESKNLMDMRKTIETICGLHNFCRRFNDCSIPKLPESKVKERKLRRLGSEADAGGVRRRDELLKEVVQGMK